MTDVNELPNGKAVKFRTLAEKRVSRALKIIRQIGKLSSRSSYEYNPEQVNKIFGVLQAELETAEHKFAQPQPKPKQETLFTL